jgi:signal transduction histidine kinase
VDAEDSRLALIVREPAPDEDEQFVSGILAAARLGLELRARLQDLTMSERRNRALLDAIPDNMFRVRADGTYLDFHANVPEYLVIEPENIIGNNVYTTLPREQAELVMAGVRHAVGTGTLATVEYQLMRRIGLRDVEARIVRSGEDEALIIVRDVTDRKEQETELRASRQRLVEASDLERRRLERNLHDGAQQRLVSLSLALRLAQGRVHDDPADAERLLSVASDELAQALEELRELARGIHPAVLSDRGLPAALEALADRTPVPVKFESPAERLPGPVEAAAYYVIAEALTNVAKYAEASQVEVRVERANGNARVVVADDGVGGADPSGGSGLRGLADRVEALDGRLEIESAPGQGTRVTAEIPCGS